MNFTSLTFLCFFPLVYLVYRRLPHRFRWIWLLAASYFFYINWRPEAALLLFGTTFITWFCAGMADPTGGHRQIVRQMGKWVGIMVPVLTLGIFKYADFFLVNAKGLLHLAGIDAEFRMLSLLLPVGISFYTFQTLSYVMDVSAGKIKTEKHFGYYALYVSFFPQLVAGPIEKSGHLIPQLKQEVVWSREMSAEGFTRMLKGFFKKILLADLLASYADPVFADPASACGPTVLAAVFFFSLQIYFDFSGYSDIACGAAKMLGVDLMENFRHPYLAESIHDFWKRWHISLTQWLTEYVYIPLGGNRKGKQRTMVNILIVFLISGLWHGAGWHYVLWGGLHGIYMLTENALPGKKEGGSAAERNLRRLRTFLPVMMAWMVFRAQSLQDVGILIQRLLTGWNAGMFSSFYSVMGLTLAGVLQIAAGIFCLTLLEKVKRLRTDQYFFVILAIAVGWIGLLSAGADSAFLYFQF